MTESSLNQPQSAAPTTPPPMPAQPGRRVGVWIFVSVLVALLLVSLLINLGLIAMLAGAQGEQGLATTTVRDGDSRQTVALYDIAGVIDSSAARQFQKFYNAIDDDQNVKAVVLRVESPGGAVASSDEMHEIVLRLKGKGKKVVVSMGSLAASGGYYVSAAADTIVAERTTLTGSIGVIATWFVFKGTLDKIGVDPIVMKSSHAADWKDALSPLSKPAPYQQQYIQSLLNETQETFEDVVRKGRGERLKTRKATVEVPATQEAKAQTHEHTEPFNGKIYSAAGAMELGLVDMIGYERDACDRAAKAAQLGNPKVVRYSPRHGLFTSLAEGRSQGLDVQTLRQMQTPTIEAIWRP
ncbi:MAG: S49 family peptidase [Planctomycetaceae bacterium]|nr:S49 family peptidase [Planctomycetaceae bacterium]